MRVLVDLQALQNGSRSRGIGRYVNALARAILKTPGDHDIRFLLNGLFPNDIELIIASFADLAAPDRFLIFHAAGPTAALRAENGWRAAAAHLIYEDLVKSLEPDVLLIGSLFEGGGDDSVVSIRSEQDGLLVATILYDLIPLRNPAEHIGSAGAKKWYFGKMEQARRSDLLLGISEFTCREAIASLPSDDNQVKFIGAAAAQAFAETDFGALRGSDLARDLLAYHGITQPFLMLASAFDARKNFQKLIAAYARLPDELRSSRQLVLVCKLGKDERAQLMSAVAAVGLSDDHVILTGFVPDDELRLLYANCELFVFPSSEEGFGLPIVEAMWCGAPVVGSSRSSVPEVIGNPDALFDPENADEMLAVISRALVDDGFRNALVEHSAAHARTFSWAAVAARTIDEIRAKIAELDLETSPSRLDATTRMHGLIERLAILESWPGPSDSDLLATALALERNERLSWPRSVSRASSRIDEISLA